MGFWDFFWLLVWSFFFVVFLMVLFQVITDLFRDRELSGWFKAIWVLALVVVPLLSSLVYLIVRGESMGERQAAAAREAKGSADAYIRSVAQVSPADQISSAKSLLDNGAITQAEFDTLKAKALA